MSKAISNSGNIFRHTSGFICISEREEKHLQDLLERFGTFQNVPPKEEVTACYVRKLKDKFFETEDYFFFQVNELTPLEEALSEKRRRRFLSFKSDPDFIGSKKR